MGPFLNTTIPSTSKTSTNLLAGRHSMQQQYTYWQGEHLRTSQAMPNLLLDHECLGHPALLSAKLQVTWVSCH